MDLISQFIGRYKKEYDYYDQIGRIAAHRLDTLIQSGGIRAIVTARAKNPNRLEQKIRQRESKKSYKSVDDIYADIVDLTGVRVALYFPADRAEIDRIVKSNFELLEPEKVFPDEKVKPSYKKRFSGYWATHYRLHHKESDLTDNQKRYADARFELQVASVLMHAWSEVEHDLVYKPMEGSLSDDEYAIIDELNGLVIAGEISLERLQRALKARIAKAGERFTSHYDLAAFLFDIAKPLLSQAPDDAALGRVDLLYALSEKLGINTSEAIEPYVKSLHADIERRPIAEQIIDEILGSNESRYSLYSEIRDRIDERVKQKTVSARTQQSAMGAFLKAWIRFERAARAKAKLGPQIPFVKVMQTVKFSDQRNVIEIDRIRRLRNHLVHGVEIPSVNALKEAVSRLNEITRRL
jgi:ppGpp synthetase/RelA/SpoT-type nucleotidyltranferase